MFVGYFIFNSSSRPCIRVRKSAAARYIHIEYGGGGGGGRQSTPPGTRSRAYAYAQHRVSQQQTACDGRPRIGSRAFRRPPPEREIPSRTAKT